jgi:hypothetical protein
MQKNYLEIEARRKAADIINDAETCFFITQFSGTSRPMATVKFDEEGVIWFLLISTRGKLKTLNQIQKFDFYMHIRVKVNFWICREKLS